MERVEVMLCRTVTIYLRILKKILLLMLRKLKNVSIKVVNIEIERGVNI